MLLRPVIILVAIVIAITAATPKIENTVWNSFLQIVEDVEVKKHNNEVETGRTADKSLEQTVETYMKNNDITLKVPIIGSTVTFGARNLDDNEIDLKLNFGSGSEVEARKKSKLKKIFIPILVFILLKAMTLIPLALGVLGIKTWNAIQLAFVSFIAALGMAVYKLCGKIAGDHPPQIIHNAWEPSAYNQYAARSDVDPAAQQMAYNAYAPRYY